MRVEPADGVRVEAAREMEVALPEVEAPLALELSNDERFDGIVDGRCCFGARAVEDVERVVVAGVRGRLEGRSRGR